MSAGELSLAIGLVVVIVGGALVWLFGRRAEIRRAARFSERLPLDAAALWRESYREGEVSLESVETALRLVSEATEVPAPKLRPSDRFAIELAPERGWEFDDGLAEIRWYVESKSKGSSKGLESIHDFIRLLDRLDRSEEPQPVEAR